ncbi:serine hydrolase domain-containing protein [Steroidobacter sp.]|uniref:serine hydrolase domain-containing protein n=1 Tax=Steroidobacter sp. TaxID=1978227 RepID=UPI001A59E74A|nr:serine hydrolase domain-containing protein [Steroidobacter sp.]MBL8265444.1 serine hydrolase [Steroidobacter sp.]
MTGLLAALSLLCVTLSATADDGQQREAVDAVFAKYDRTNGAGVVVGVYQAGQQRYARAFGMANLEDNVVLSTDTVFPMASVSKHFTAFAILLLAREGKVDLDADVRTYLPNVPDFGQRITVRHLLLHNSGLRDVWGMFWFAGIDSAQGGQAIAMKMVQRQRALNFAPGSEHQYSNTGYLLAAEIVKAVSGQSLREFTTKRMFQPLRMEHTFFLDDTTELVPGRPASYCWKYFYCQNEAQAWRRELGGTDVVGPTGLYATIGDLAKWAGNFLNPTVGDKALIDQFVSLGSLDGGAPINYGFGLWHQKMAGHEVIMHNGANEAFRTVFVVLPEQKFSVAIMANTMMDVGQLAEEVVRIYLGERRGEPVSIPKVVTPDAATVAAVAGHYQRIGQTHIAFDGKGRQLRLVSSAAPPVVMQFRADGTFDAGDEARQSGQYFRPVRDGSGRVIALDQGGSGQDPFSDSGAPLRHLRVAAIDESKVDLREFVGDYRSAELDFTCSVSIVDGALTLEAFRLPVPIPLTPTYKDGFQGKRYFLHVVAERGADGRVSALLASSASDRNVRFDRVN